jgi:hypothetical protein
MIQAVWDETTARCQGARVKSINDDPDDSLDPEAWGGDSEIDRHHSGNEDGENAGGASTRPSVLGERIDGGESVCAAGLLVAMKRAERETTARTMLL